MLSVTASAQPTAARPPASYWRDAGYLILLCTILFGAGLGRYALSNPDEGRYAEIPREMLATSDYVTPRLNGVKYFEKPPLLYWLVAGSLHLLGPSEGAARAVPALFGLLGVLLLYFTVRRRQGRAAAWWAALVQATSLLYFAHSRILLIDMVVSVLISAVLCCFLLGVNEAPGPARRWLFYGLYASAALATLAKGLIGFLLPGAVMFLWLLLFNQWRRLRPLYLPSGLLLFLAIAAPWHLLVAQRNPEWAWFYFVHEHWLRFTTTTHGRYEPWWFFLPVLVLGLFPWTGFAFSSLRQTLAGGWARRDQLADDWFLLLWAGFILLFFSASQSKLVPYILPVLPPLAWLAGRHFAQLYAGRTTGPWRTPLTFSAVFSILLGAALMVALFKPGIIKSAEQLAQLRPLFLPAAVALCSAGILILWLLRHNQPKGALAALLGATALLYYGLVLAAPVIARPGTKSLAEIVAREAEPDDLVLHYREFFHDFAYYARRPVGLVGLEGGELEIFLDTAAQKSGRFLPETDLQSIWTARKQVFLVARRSELPELEKHPWFHARILGEEPNHVLLTNHY